MSDRFKKNRIELSEINRLARMGDRLVLQSDSAYKGRLASVVDRIVHGDTRMALVAGPSSSGKTTSSLLIARELRRRGKNSLVISMDDFFKDPEFVKTRKPDGTANYETIEAVDLDYFHQCALALIRGESAKMPKKRSATAQREYEEVTLGSDRSSVLVVEGLHALNPLTWQALPHDKILRVYATLFDEFTLNGQPFLSTSEIRISRRLLRDAAQRGVSTEKTLDMWSTIEEGADQFIRPFRDHADTLLNTSFNCELGILKGRVLQLCADPQEGGAHRDKLLDLGEKFSQVETVSGDALPKDSMIREFLGGLEL